MCVHFFLKSLKLFLVDTLLVLDREKKEINFLKKWTKKCVFFFHVPLVLTLYFLILGSPGVADMSI